MKCDVCTKEINNLPFYYMENGDVRTMCPSCYTTTEDLMARHEGITRVQAVQIIRDSLPPQMDTVADKVHDIFQTVLGSDLGTEVMRNLGDIVYEASDFDNGDEYLDDETLEIVRVDKKALTAQQYRAMEYDFLNLDVMEFEDERDELNALNELMDAALLGNDIEWAKSLHKQIRRLKGERIE